MKRLASAFAAMVFLLLFTKTATAEAERTLAGPGTLSCGMYLEKVEETYGEFILVGWMQGYLSGINVARAKNNKELINLPDHAAIKAYARKYCGDYPLAPLYIAVGDLASEIGMFK